MSTTHKLHEIATPEMTAKAWDDTCAVAGPGRISARYGSPSRSVRVCDATLSPCPGRLDRAAADQSRPVRAGMAQAAAELTETDIRGCHIPPRQPGPRRMASRPCE